MRQIILDTETTGLSPQQGHRIIEIGCMEMVNRRLTGNDYHVYINPEREIDAGAMKVHGITNEFLEDKPLFASLAKAFLDYIKGAELIIHNAPFDVGFINHEFMRVDGDIPKVKAMCSIVDTLTMARRKHPGQQNSLNALCKRYQVDNSKRDLHGALVDADLLAQVYLLMTGGQRSIFAGEEVADKTSAKLSSTKVARTTQILPVIKATDQELKTHQEFIDELL